MYSLLPGEWDMEVNTIDVFTDDDSIDTILKIRWSDSEFQFNFESIGSSFQSPVQNTGL